MQTLKIFLWLLVAYLVTFINARAMNDNFARRFEELASDSENDERFNEISDLEDIDEDYFPKRKGLFEERKQRSKSNRNWDASTKKSGNVDELTSQVVEIERGFVRPMVSSMFNVIRNAMLFLQ